MNQEAAKPRWLLSISVGLLLCALVLVFVVGIQVGLERGDEYRKQIKSLQQTKADQEETIRELRQDRVFYARGAEVESQAAEILRAGNKTLQDRVAQLAEDNAYYLRVLKPDKENQGLSIGPLHIKATATAGRYRFNVSVIQVAGKERVAGRADLTVIGLFDGDQVELPLAEIAASPEEAIIDLGFRNYQAISGEFSLPQNFTPEQVRIDAFFDKVKELSLSKLYDWHMQESNFNVERK